jgi:hypothetical protein
MIILSYRHNEQGLHCTGQVAVVVQLHDDPNKAHNKQRL